jgi:hypothetical protein
LIDPLGLAGTNHCRRTTIANRWLWETALPDLTIAKVLLDIMMGKNNKTPAATSSPMEDSFNQNGTPGTNGRRFRWTTLAD